ncbi:MAG TPA: MotA/TolQ/ExbB proton channel family protein [Pseudomonadota bacterium]|jgi:biopolymer transport protein ExbB|nr:MotA/TolQ/ExbB proton channel family protein [Pseudomonadota bacterium]HNK43955.1 MotA/TolQ/ExbB proton channel family protein [Pseudomonadota bacterium]HNN49984.1 MotA/TolQ/ExbB proton channel family protein [Pseudomonadota bacterium]
MHNILLSALHLDFAALLDPVAQAASAAASKPGTYDSIRDWYKSADRITLLTLGAMILCSLAAVTVAIERTLSLWNIADSSRRLAEQVRRAVYRGALADARTACQRSKSPLADVMLVGFERIGRSSNEALFAAVERERQRMVLSLRGPLWVLGTIGATTPFLGLFGTVVGIMGAFRKIGESNQAGIQVVGPYIAEALIATAVGIGIAVVALLVFNYFQSRLARTSIELRLAIEEFLEELTEAHGRDPDAGNPKSDDKSDGKDKHAKTASEEAA